MQSKLDELLDLFSALGWGRDCYGRNLICTPFEGNYGPAGWVLCLDGSPPRGTLLVLSGKAELPFSAFYTDGVRSKKLQVRQEATVRRFWQEHLEHATEAIEFRASAQDSRRTMGREVTA